MLTIEEKPVKTTKKAVNYAQGEKNGYI